MVDLLTKSEAEVVELRCLGLIEKEIAEKRSVSIYTVKTQVKNAISRTGARSLYELVARYAQANPNIFKNMAVGLFLAIQVNVIATNTQIDKRFSKNRTRTVKTARRAIV